MNVSITDEKLIAAITNDDYTSYNKLFIRYYSRLCCYVYRLLGEKEDAEDVVQELFLTLWNNRKRLAIGENVSGYLYKMARNLALNHIRTQTNYKTVLENRENNFLITKKIRLRLKNSAWPFTIVSTCCLAGVKRCYSFTASKD